MRRIVVTGAMLMAGLAQAGALQAGVYNLDPPRNYVNDFVETHVPQPMGPVMNYLFALRAIQDNPSNPNPSLPPPPLRASYLKQLAELEDRKKDGVLTVADRVNLGACLVRMGRSAEAQRVLEESLRQVPSDDPLRILLLLNLAAACQEDDTLLPRALQLQREALRTWPALVPSWKRHEYIWFRYVEQYVLALMELRNREAILRGGRPMREQLPPDRLFPREERDVDKRVQFVGESGEYEAGGIAWKHFERLPLDADSIVLQLLLWRPFDVRLLWLYGELQNIRGRVSDAHAILNKWVREQSQWRSRDLNQHIRVLQDALGPYRELFTDPSGMGDNLRKQALLLWWLAPRGALLAPPVGAAANEIGGVAASADPSDPAAMQQMVAVRDAGVSNAPAARSALPDWRQLAVSFVAGMVVAVLAMLQWQQWRRRRAGAAAPFTSPSSMIESSRYSRPTDG